MRTSFSLASLLVLSIATVGCAAAPDDTSTSDGDAASVAGKFELFQGADSQWYFHVKAGNGQILLTSEGYTSRVGALTGLLSAETNGVDPREYTLVQSAHGYSVDLLAANHAILGTTEIYSSKSNATRAIGTVSEAITSYLDVREAHTTGARVDIEAGESGQFHFNFVAQNGQIVLTSQSYGAEASAYDGAFAVQGAAASAYTVKANSAGGYYFLVSSPNGQVIGQSQQYTTKASAQAGVAAVQKLAPSVSIL